MDGMAIAFAVAEFLLSTTAYCLFVTHYSQITLLPQLYSNATNVHLKSTVSVPRHEAHFSSTWRMMVDTDSCVLIDAGGS